MTGTSAVGLFIIAGVAAGALAIWLGLVFWAGSHPFWKGRRPETRSGDVRGGAFLGEGRAVTPHRDAEPEPDREWPEPTNEPVAPDHVTGHDEARPRER